MTWPYLRPVSWKNDFDKFYRNSAIYNPGLGASGAINSIVAWSILTSPMTIIWVNLIVPVPAALAGILFIGKDLYELKSGQSNVGNAAHLGGAFVGACYFFLRRLRR